MVILKQSIDHEKYDAVLFDLDGVVTKTADTHANAWKNLFDEYLNKKSTADCFLPFDPGDDYLKYVDGKPRYKGVQAFLASRNIDIPYGYVDDAPDQDTICGLGNRKNQLFSELLKTEGVKVYDSTIHLIKQLRKNGLKTAIVSSSKNCRKVLKAAKIEALFDTRVDGVVSAKLGLTGKPEPDIFIEAAKQLDADPDRCVVVEDALSGVEAGKKGGFGMIIGVNRADHAEGLKQKGAHLVVSDLCEITAGILVKNLPQALQSFWKIMKLIDGKEIVVFLDYDSIISYMSPLPQGNGFSSDIKKIVTTLANQYTVIIVTCKGVKHLKEQINISTIYYADCKKYEIHGPDGLIIKLNNRDHELKQAMDKDKGKAFVWFLKKLNLISRIILPIFLGDNANNLHAFEAMGENSIGIVIGDDLHSSKACFRLDSPNQIRRFLLKLSPNLHKGTSWTHIYVNFDPEDEGRREALCALGNGYFVTRGAAPEAEADGIHYPGTYLAGGYNRLKTKVAGKTIENEDLVNIPNWLCLNFCIDKDEWFKIEDVKILFYRQYLNIKKGVLNRIIRFRDKKERETIISQQTFVHGEQMHRAGLKIIITPLNWEGEIKICSALDGKVTNRGVKRYQALNNKHLDLVESRHVDKKNMCLKMRTNQSCLDIAIGARTEIFHKNKTAAIKYVQTAEPDGYIAKHFVTNITRAEDITVEKLICIHTSRDTGISECLAEAENTILNDTSNYDCLLESHATAWGLLWRKFDVKLELGNCNIEQYTQKVIRLYIFHLLQSSSVHSLDIDVGMPARGWHGEGYRGHIFWDEMIIFPFLNFRVPRITKTLLMYRYRRLQEAKHAAKNAGYNGAMYPWQSGSNGREETQQVHLNPESGRWLEDNTHLQRHVNNAIVYNIWQYFQITHDIEFLSFYGGEMIVEIARFWASIATYTPELDRYEILHVMGPDEYHDSYPNACEPGLNNNAYTNLMVMFVMNQALNLQHVIPEQDWDYLRKKLKIENGELAKWKKMSRRMKIVFQKDGIISQFEGYEDLKEFDWDGYKKKYGNIQRLDRILEKEGDSPNNYKLCKQADVLMLFYLFSAETLKKMFKHLDYPIEKNFIQKNINYYLKRTTNGSSLAMVIHSWIEARQARARSWNLFSRALETDMVDDQAKSTKEGIHLAAMSGCIDILQRGYAGMEIRSDIFILNPLLPKSINRICFHIRYRKHWLDLKITHKEVRIKSLTSRARPITIMIKDEIIRLYPGNKSIVTI